jgi:hypothetical protein
MEFGELIRINQAIFRDTSTTISEAGKNPTDQKGERNHHLLAFGAEIENLFPEIRGEEHVLRFFADRGIKWWKSSRSGDDCSRVGPTRNMASSQVFCLNFWYPIKRDVKMLTAIIKSIEPNVEDVVEINSISVKGDHRLASFVEFEWVGSSTTLEKKAYSRGSKATSIDAFVTGVSKGKRIGFFFEWKLVEEYRGDDLGEGRSGTTRRDAYKQYLEATECLFSRNIPLNAVLYEPFYQIFRMGLLGQKMVYEDKELDQVYVIPVYPRDNLAYSERITSPWLRDNFSSDKTVSEIASHFFIKPVVFKATYADALWGTIKDYGVSPKYSEWVEYMDNRYFRNGV